ncbi:sigma-70 family RNA polymerase sigma factor [Neobacillus sp. LXY-4]|uniref:sigma-70 family RNA polymerase sigma factor n=1 Tax=Neobacillus sp. LXY-4 TaxID=3379826 RepID=UPI003EE1EB43
MEKEQLFIETVYENKGYFYRIAKRILQNETDVEDAIQDMIIKGYRSIKGLKEERYIKTWLTRILINQCKTILKKRKRVVFSGEFQELSQCADYQKMEIEEYLNQLTQELKVIAVLYYYDDLPVKDIAEFVNVPIGTIKSRLSKVRTDLRRMMEE